MTKLVYLDCHTGIAGDMCLGALVSAGVPLHYLTEQLKGLGIEQEFVLRAEDVHHNNQLATKVHVDLLSKANLDHNPDHKHQHDHAHTHHHGHDHASDFLPNSGHQTSAHTATRHLPEIEQLITSAKFPPRVSEWSIAVFRKLAQAEAAVHGVPPEKVHFHEVGATDAIVDIVGTCLGLDWLGIDHLYCSALPTGGGTVRAAHGRLPVPVPAVMKLWESRQVPIYSNGIERELVTPTGAAIVTTLATGFGPPPAMTLQRVGNGAGSLQLPIPNILRLWIGELTVGARPMQRIGNEGISHLNHLTPQPSPLASRAETESPAHPPHSPLKGRRTEEEAFYLRDGLGERSNPLSISQSPQLETISVLETQIDDLSPQAIGYVFEALFNVGAVDVFTQAIGMKKSRLGVLLTVVCHPQDIEACEAVLFRETTTLGIRRLTQERAILSREIQYVQTDYGEVRVKVAWGDSMKSKIMNVQPEYEDCAELAKANNLPWREIHQLALQSWYRQYENLS